MTRYPCLWSRNDSSDFKTIHDIEVAGYRYVILTICIFGTVCNILNLCVLVQRRLKESPYTYLTGLAVADMLTLISISPFSIVRGDYIRHKDMFFSLTRLESQFYMPLANYFGQISIMITLALTIERYLFTTYPLRTRSFCKARYARIVITIIIILCALLSFPRFLMENVKEVIGPINSFSSSSCTTQPFIIKESSANSSYIGQCFCVSYYSRKKYLPYRNAYYITMFILNQILPVFVLLFLNLKLIRRVQNSNRFTLDELIARQFMYKSTSSTLVIHPIKQKRLRDEHRLTKTLVSIVLVFLVCNTFTIISYPEFVVRVTRKRYPNYMHTGFRVQKLITNLMLLLNYSINFFFYCAFNQKFLDTLKTTFSHKIYSYIRDKVRSRNRIVTTQRNLINSTPSSANSSCILPSKLSNSIKNQHNNDDEVHRIQSHDPKNCSLKKTKDFGIEI